MKNVRLVERVLRRVLRCLSNLERRAQKVVRFMWDVLVRIRELWLVRLVRLLVSVVVSVLRLVRLELLLSKIM